jgi:MFS family permease
MSAEAAVGSEPAPEPPPASRNPFTAPGFARWWTASLVAGTGVGIQSVTVPLFIRDRVSLDERALAISAALIAGTLPGALLALVGGTFADRVERRRILARTYAIAALISTAYVALSGFDVRAIWPVFPLAATVGAAGAFTNPARQSMIPQLLSREQLQNGIIFGTMGFMATLQFLGPSLGGLVTEASSLTTAFGLEVVLLALGALLFAGVHTPLPEPRTASVLKDLLGGLRYVRSEPALRSLLALGTVIGVLFIGPFAVTVPILVPDVFAAGDKWVGLLWGCFGGGVFAGSLILTRWRAPRRGLAALVSILAGGLVTALYGLTSHLLLAGALQVVHGLFASVFINYVVALLQENTDPRMMGRVMSMYSLAFFASMPVGYAQAGAVTTRFGPAATLVSSGLCAALVALAALLTARSIRSLR